MNLTLLDASPTLKVIGFNYTVSRHGHLVAAFRDKHEAQAYLTLVYPGEKYKDGTNI